MSVVPLIKLSSLKYLSAVDEKRLGSGYELK